MSNSNTKYEFKGTPGPWVQTGGSYHFIDGPENYNIDEEGRHSIAELYGPDAPANKALFLASPALLSALIKAVKTVESVALGNYSLDNCRDIDKLVQPVPLKYYPEWYAEAKQAIEEALNIHPKNPQ